jgi:hypothetical protein
MTVQGADEVFPSHPVITLGAAMPVAPGLILTYHEYQVSGLNGFGGWSLYLWDGVGTHEVLTSLIWIS